MRQRLNLIFGISLIVCDIAFFIPATFELLRTGGGPWGFGLLLLPITIVGNLYLLPATLALSQRYKDNRALLIINISGVLGSLFWIVFFLTTPK